MDGFSRAQLRAFSKRSAQIEAELEAKGAMYESPALRMQADDEASLATRTGKDHSLTPSLLAGRWQQRGGAGRPGRRGRAGAGGVPADAGLGGAGLGGDHRGPGRSRRSGCAPGRPGSPRPMWSSTSAPCRAAGSTVEEITALADRFVDSDLAVRLTPDDRGGPAPAAAVVDRRAPGAGGPHRWP